MKQREIHVGPEQKQQDGREDNIKKTPLEKTESNKVC